MRLTDQSSLSEIMGDSRLGLDSESFVIYDLELLVRRITSASASLLNSKKYFESKNRAGDECPLSLEEKDDSYSESYRDYLKVPGSKWGYSTDSPRSESQHPRR